MLNKVNYIKKNKGHAEQKSAWLFFKGIDLQIVLHPVVSIVYLPMVLRN